MSRYARQMILPEIGQTGQAALGGAHVLVVGAGGLGATALPALVGAGVGRITLVDDDHVEEHNLHRQTLFTMEDVGRPKADAAGARLKALNPEVEIVALCLRFDPSNAAELVTGCDVALDAADSFAVTYTLSDACHAAGVAMIAASVLRLAGYVGGFCGRGPSYRALFPAPDAQQGTCASAGVLGPAVAMIGALQAQMALSVLLDLAPSPIGRLASFDLKTYRFSTFGFSSAPEPAAPLRFVAPAQIVPGDRVFDLRGVEETPEIAPFATRLDPSDAAAVQPVEGRTILCCRSGLRAWRAAETLERRGHGNLALMALGEGARG